MVPDYASATFTNTVPSIKELEGVEVKENSVIAHGKSAHAALPEKGTNAIVKLAEAILPDVKGDEVKQVLHFILDKVDKDVYGGLMGINFEDEPSGKLTMNLGMIEINETEAVLIFNIRYPVTDKSERIVKIMDEVAKPYCLRVVDHRDQKPLFVKEDHT